MLIFIKSWGLELVLGVLILVAISSMQLEALKQKKTDLNTESSLSQAEAEKEDKKYYF